MERVGGEVKMCCGVNDMDGEDHRCREGKEARPQ